MDPQLEYYNRLTAPFLELARDPSPSALQRLREVLEARDHGTFESKHIVPHLASRALIAKGVQGVEVLAAVLPEAQGHIYPLAILTTLWQAAQGKHARGALGFEQYLDGLSDLNAPIPIEVQSASREQFVRFLGACRSNPASLERLLTLLQDLQSQAPFADQSDALRFHQSVLTVLADTALRVSESAAASYAALLQAKTREEQYHQFFVQNPVFLDPLGSRLISKQRLGDEYVTDYVLELLTGEYIAVEIEKPTDPIFTQGGDFSYQFTHAFGQVLGFLEWLDQNVAYAQRRLPGILNARGLLVIGSRGSMGERELGKLRRFNLNSVAVKVRTFDDLLASVESLLKNIRVRETEFVRNTPRGAA